MNKLNGITFSKLLCIAFIGTILSACSGSDDASMSSDTSTTGSVTLGVTDAPVDEAEEVVVQFTGVEILPGEEGGEAETQTFMFDEPRTIDLLALQGSSRDLLLDGEELPAGNYGQIRLMVNAEHDSVFDSYIVISGAQHELRVPSGSTSGLKLIHNFDVEAEGSMDFTIDFDLRKSIVFAPGTGYMLKPVLKLIETDEASSLTGTVQASVFTGQTCSGDPLEGYAVYLYATDGTIDDLGSANEPVATAGVNLDEESMYRYEFGFLEAGDYKVVATCVADTDDPEVDDEIAFAGEATVSVSAEATTTHDFL